MNNAVGWAWQSVEDMQRAVEIYLQEIGWEGNPEKRSEHCALGGWYSIAVMAKAITSKSMENAGKVEYVLDMRPLCQNPDRIYSSVVLGAIVNIDNKHWVALRNVADKLWLLDSLRGRPVALTEKEFRVYMKKHGEHAYCIELAENMSLPFSSGAMDSGTTAAPHESASPLLPLVDSSGAASGTAVEPASMEVVSGEELVEDSAMGGEDSFPLDAAAPALAIAEQISPEDAKRGRERLQRIFSRG